MKYLFKTSVTTQDENGGGYLLKTDVVPETIVEAASVDEAFIEFRKQVNKPEINNLIIMRKTPLYGQTNAFVGGSANYWMAGKNISTGSKGQPLDQIVDLYISYV
jgi:hypothetical protein